MHMTWCSWGLSLLFVLQAALAQKAMASKNWLNGLPRTVVEFEVVDEEGNPVPDATASVVFVKNDSLYNAKGDHGRTDADGRLAMGGFSTGEVIFNVAKDGYYRTYGRVWFQRHRHVADGTCWEMDKLYGQDFWPAENQAGKCHSMSCKVVLKKVRNPHPMLAFDVDTAWPPDMEEMGFDLEVGDWVVPKGKGKQVDVLFRRTTVENGIPGDCGEQVKMVFGENGSGDGCICLDKEFWSERGWLVEAPENNYEEQFAVSEQSAELAAGEKYLVVRTRVIRDHKGNIVSARYGLIPQIRITRRKSLPAYTRIQFFGWMNTQNNERGLENTYLPFKPVR
jgi:protocatechuate 3,4-dioxygenase beta subunit